MQELVPSTNDEGTVTTVGLIVKQHNGNVITNAMQGCNASSSDVAPRLPRF